MRIDGRRVNMGSQAVSVDSTTREWAKLTSEGKRQIMTPKPMDHKAISVPAETSIEIETRFRNIKLSRLLRA
jgi:hypothetical protein